MHTPVSRRIGALLAAAAVAALTACGDDAADTAAPVTEPPDAEAATGETLDVTAVDYAFEGLAARTLATGTTLTLTNASEKEVHELVLVRVDDDETRSVEELLQLPEEEAGEVTTFQGVAVALPGEEGQVLEGDLTVEEPGRYVALCFIPTGADPEVVAEAMQSPGEGPPDLGEGAPHFTRGMVAEFEVSG